MHPLLLPFVAAGFHLALADTPEPPPAGPVDRAVTLLSRFGPGELPVTPPVLDAIADLADHGDGEVLPLLESLRAHERAGVSVAAEEALVAVEARDLVARRAAFVSALPRRAAVERWLDGHADPLQTRSGEPLGSAERGALAYAVLVLGEAPARGPDPLELVSPDAAARLLQEAVSVEREGKFIDAVVGYAQALASGAASAAAHLDRLGVDPERLLLGMTAQAASPPASTLPAAAVEPLLASHGRLTIAVLIERSAREAPLERVVALDALDGLDERALMTPRERAAARQRMLEAARDPLPAVRMVAEPAVSRAARDAP